MTGNRREVAMDVVQQSAEAAITSAGHVMAILGETARKITTELGAFGSEVAEIVTTTASRRPTGDE